MSCGDHKVSISLPLQNLGSASQGIFPVHYWVTKLMLLGALFFFNCILLSLKVEYLYYLKNLSLAMGGLLAWVLGLACGHFD